MNQKYSPEINVQVVVCLLKKHGIKNIIASPGATNVALLGTLQGDPFFNIYSAVDERSAAYMACGMAQESGEPVVLSCTGATASRNYVPGLTEAYYRKLPVLAITSCQAIPRIGHLVAQVIDRETIQNDIAKLAVTLPIVKDDEELWDCQIKVNKALIGLSRDGGGPVHINLPTTYKLPFITGKMPEYRYIQRITNFKSSPKLKSSVGIFIGSKSQWSQSETEALDKFCEENNGAVFCDHTSGYKGKYRLLFGLVGGQVLMRKDAFKPDVTIHIGEVSGDYYSHTVIGHEVWRVSPDGEVRDTFRKLKYIFEMNEEDFFNHYSYNNEKREMSFFQSCKEALDDMRDRIPEIPLSNIWVASQLHNKIPDGSVLHFGILNSLRSWNFFEVDKTITTNTNVGGFGTDGILSAVIGASLASPNRLCFCVLGDLAFFYDMNSLGNRHVGNNLRILIINNGKGTEFRNSNHQAAYFKESADEYIAAAGHFGNKSKSLAKNFVESLGFEYISANSKEAFRLSYKRFVDEKVNKSIVFEVFTDSYDESLALEKMLNIQQDNDLKMKAKTKKILGNKGLKTVKTILRR
ncbi:thiamine pyrophosphate-binding protein [Vibrio viridaestus]|uniref:2-succinyl-5-enolpyruvyl-6-hydroxy-3-cyclohexene-1-carboxylate synthase n=1 Tax=Vibrio viridaestus TaxID=2487322 RepID=A0A3N9TIX9_9VIBR|nr:thiamine pyrophosphate-binding protein [Vibrio viridaestus]RQW63874.1 2-succinyl-5-enolpyruvyl-6-hydroxy-3-cyclohexene-1-carboxylate synthase [Vibrio viridaestus]